MRIHSVLPFALVSITGCTVGATLPYGSASIYSTGDTSGGYEETTAAAPPSRPGTPGVEDGLPCVQDGAGRELSAAAPIGVGVHAGCVVGKQDAYVITAPADAGGGALYTMRITADDQICLAIFDQDRRKQGTACSDDREPRAFWAAIAPGTQLFLRLERTLNDAAPYRLEIEERLLHDPDEPNNGIKNAVELEPGESHMALMQLVLNDEKLANDVYIVDVERAGTLSFNIDPGSDDTTTGVEIYDRDRRKVDTATADNPGAVLRGTTQVSPGRYYIQVAEFHSTVDAAGASTTYDERPSAHFFKPYTISVDLEKKTKRVARR
jgi:hypothetical protein